MLKQSIIDAIIKYVKQNQYTKGVAVHRHLHDKGYKVQDPEKGGGVFRPLVKELLQKGIISRTADYKLYWS